VTSEDPYRKRYAFVVQSPVQPAPMHAIAKSKKWILTHVATRARPAVRSRAGIQVSLRIAARRLTARIGEWQDLNGEVEQDLVFV